MARQRLAPAAREAVQLAGGAGAARLRWVGGWDEDAGRCAASPHLVAPLQPQPEPALALTHPPHHAAASYRYRRDYAGVANSTWALNRLQPLPLEDARRGRHESRLLGAAEPLAADLHPPALRQEIAWELVLRDLREAEVRQQALVCSERRACGHGRRLGGCPSPHAAALHPSHPTHPTPTAGARRRGAPAVVHVRAVGSRRARAPARELALCPPRLPARLPSGVPARGGVQRSRRAHTRALRGNHRRHGWASLQGTVRRGTPRCRPPPACAAHSCCLAACSPHP